MIDWADTKLRPTMSWSIGILTITVVLAVLYIGQSFLVPLAIAVLVVNLLNAVIARIETIHIGTIHVPRWTATILAILIILAGFAVIFEILVSQVDAIAEARPRYAERFTLLIEQTVAYIGDDAAEAVAAAFNNLDLGAQLSRAVGSAGNMLSSFLLVCLYVGFMLADQSNLPQKISALLPDKSDADGARAILKSISDGVRRYMSIKTLVSVMTGGISYVVMKLIGLDFAETWAVVIFLLNYIPSIGSILGVIFPATLALIQFDNYVPFAIIALGLGCIQFVIGNIIEPAMTGRSLNLSAFVIITSLTFWGALWGIMGMFLSVPIMVMLMIVCTHVPGWRWIAVLLSQDGQLDFDDEI